MDWNTIDLDDLLPRLILYAAGRLSRTEFNRRNGTIPGGREASDLASTALLHTISGTSPWAGDVSLFDHLTTLMDRQIEEMIVSEENLESETISGRVIQLRDFRFTPEEEAARAELERKFLEYLHQKKPELRKLAEWILRSPTKSASAEVSVAFEISIGDVESLKRALRRAVLQFKALHAAFEFPAIKRDAQADR